MTPRPPPHSRKAGEARGTGRASAERQARDAIPPEPTGPEPERIARHPSRATLRAGLRPSPWTDRQEKDHGRRRAQAARQGIPQPTEGNGSYRPHSCASGTATNPSPLLLRCRREATLGLALASLGPADGGQPGLRAVAVDKPPLRALCQQPPR